jgi:predicted DNA-binding transcriptional regulator AlpA
MPASFLDENRLLRKKEVLKLLGNIVPATLWLWVKRGDFPPPIVLNEKSRFIAWKQQEVLAWMEQRQRSFLAAPTRANAARRRQRRGYRVVLLPAAERGRSRT